MTYAIIGCGRIAANHIAAARENGLTLAALCDSDESAMDSLAGKFGLDGLPRYTDHRRMLEEISPRLTAIATPSGSHGPLALDCIEAGSSLIVEKPLALSLEEADAVIRAAQRRGVALCACHQNRFNRSVAAIRRALEAGRFGRMLYGTAQIRWNRGKDYYDQAPWRGTWEQDGGALMNQCIHNIDLLRWMMGDEVQEVMAYTDRQLHPYIHAEDLGLALVRFKGPSYGLIEGTTNVFPENLEETLCLFGERGTVKAGGKSVNRMEVWRFADASPGEEERQARECGEAPANVYGFGHISLYADVIAAVREGRPPLCDGQAGRRALELVLGIYRSAATGQPVTFPLQGGSTAEFLHRFDR